MSEKLFKVETFIPQSHVDQVVDALNEVGALTIGGNYDYCVFRSRGVGSWRPLEGADPFMGHVGNVSKEEETKIEFTCRQAVVKDALDTIEQAHPYEEVVINVLPVFTREDFA